MNMDAFLHPSNHVLYSPENENADDPLRDLYDRYVAFLARMSASACKHDTAPLIPLRRQLRANDEAATVTLVCPECGCAVRTE